MCRPEIHAELDAVLARMMALKPDDRYATPQAVMEALAPFVKPEMRDHLLLPASQAVADLALALPQETPGSTRMHHLLIVDDETPVRHLCRLALQSEEIQCDEAVDGFRALEATKAKRYDLVLLD